MDWQKAAEAWARSKNRDSSGIAILTHFRNFKPSNLFVILVTPRSDMGRITPRSQGQRTPRYDDMRNEMDRSRMKNMSKSPRSIRSTPRTNTSPHSMSLGDATPLYDESI